MSKVMERYYDPRDWQNRLIPWKKYLIPWGCLSPFSKKVRAPSSFVHLTAQNGSSTAPKNGDIRVLPISTDSGLEEAQVKVLQNGNWKTTALPAIPAVNEMLYVFPNGRCVGRNSCLVDREGQAVFETAFLHKFGVHGPKKFFKWDPRYWQHRRRGNLTARTSIPAPSKLVGNAISLNNVSCHNFYHWFVEIAPRIVSAQLANIQVDHYIVDHQSKYQKWVLETLGTTPDQWVQPHCNLSLEPDQLLWCTPPGASLWKFFADEIRKGMTKSSRLSGTAGTEQETDIKLYISRQSAGHRKIVDETRLIQSLEKIGFVVYDFAKIPMSRQIQLVTQATQIVSVHGAALAHLMFARPGTQVVEIMPEGRANVSLFPNMSRQLGIDHVVVMAGCSRHRQRLTIEVSDVLQALEQFKKSFV